MASNRLTMKPEGVLAAYAELMAKGAARGGDSTEDGSGDYPNSNLTSTSAGPDETAAIDGEDAAVLEKWASLTPEGLEAQLRSDLMGLLPSYDEDDMPSAVALQLIVKHRRAVKEQFDGRFRVEMHVYNKNVLPCAPMMLDLCDLLEDSFDECRDTGYVLQHSRRSASHSVRLLSVVRRRDRLRELKAAMDEALGWQVKHDQVIAAIEEGKYPEACEMLGARLYKESGSPIQQLPRRPLPQSNTSSAAAQEEPNRSSREGQKSPKRRQRSATIAYISSAHGATSRQLSPPPQAAEPAPVEEEEEALVLEEGLVCRSPRSQQAFELAEFIESVGGVSSGTVLGRALLEQFHNLRANGTNLVVDAIRMDIRQLLTTSSASLATAEACVAFRNKFIAVLQGLAALKVKGDSVLRFVLEVVEAVLEEEMLRALTEALDADAGDSWSAVADTLVPAEFHSCTAVVLAHLCTLMRHVLRLQRLADAIALQQVTPGVPGGYFGDEPQPVPVLARSLAALRNKAVQKLLATVLSYASQIKLSRCGKVEDSLQVYRLMLLFVDVVDSASNDRAASSAKQALLAQCNRLLTDAYENQNIESLCKVFNGDRFAPFPATQEDLPELFSFIMRPEEESERLQFREYLKAKPLPANAAALVVDDALIGGLLEDSDGLVNPFYTKYVEADFYAAIPAAPHPLQLFDKLPLFTFSSLMTCKTMLEVAATAQKLPEVTAELLSMASYYACVYMWFITTHFVSSTETVPLDMDTNVPTGVRNFAKTIRDVVEQKRLPPQFPLFPNAVMCHAWKSRAAVPGDYAALERSTAISSLDTVVNCHRLVMIALTPLAQQNDAAEAVAAVSEAMSSVSKYCSTVGLRRLALNLFPPEAVSAPIERFRWDAATNSFPHSQDPGSLTQATTGVLEAVQAIHKKLQAAAQMEQCTFLGFQRVMDHVVFIALTSFVDGISRIKKLSDSGRNQLLNDALVLTKSLKSSHPTTSVKLLDYVLRYARASIGPFQEALEFISASHSLYSSRQLLALGDREGFMKKREVEQLLARLQHEDKLPLLLMDA